ncbi:MAG TPA: hypothetical protein VLE99_03155 [Candidatus Saccharimonadales bacterium]|nr:hypothetical protein [Candidatus Saccharimonadales bacterium]
MPMPEEPTIIHPASELLDPVRLRNIPSALSNPVSTEQIASYRAWYDFVVDTAHGGLQPSAITEYSESRFASGLYELLSSSVAYGFNRQTHPVLPSAAVLKALRAYYRRFPPRRGALDVLQSARTRHQNDMQDIVDAHRDQFLEMGVVIGLRRAFYEEDHAAVSRQSGRYMHAARATYAITSAEGKVIASLQDQ